MSVRVWWVLLPDHIVCGLLDFSSGDDVICAAIEDIVGESQNLIMCQLTVYSLVYKLLFSKKLFCTASIP